MDQMVHPANLSMHAIQTCNLALQIFVHEVVLEPAIEFLVAFFASRPELIKSSDRQLRSSRTTGTLPRCQGFRVCRRMCQAPFASTHRETVLSCPSCLC